MHIEILLTPHVWLQVKPETRVKLAKAFGMKRSTSPRCIVERGISRIESDGHTIEDLRALNVYSMHKFLGLPMIDLSADIHKLFSECVDMIERVDAVEDTEARKEEEKATEPPVEPATKAPFCDSCDSKGVKHKKACIKNLTV